MAVVALEVKTRQALAGGRDFGDVGRYAQIDGTAHFPTIRLICSIVASPISTWPHKAAMVSSISLRISGS